MDRICAETLAWNIVIVVVLQLEEAGIEELHLRVIIHILDANIRNDRWIKTLGHWQFPCWGISRY